MGTSMLRVFRCYLAQLPRQCARQSVSPELIRSTTENGYVTYEVDALLSRDDIKSEQIEYIWRKLARWV